MRAKEDRSLGWPYSGKNPVPGEMFVVGAATAPGKRLVQQFKLSDLCQVQQPPVWKRAAAFAAYLIAKEARYASHDAIVMGFCDPALTAILNSDQTLALNCIEDQLVDGVARR